MSHKISTYPKLLSLGTAHRSDVVCRVLGGDDSLASIDFYTVCIVPSFVLELRSLVRGGEVIVGACRARESETGVKECVIPLVGGYGIGSWLARRGRGISGVEAAAGNL